MNIESTLREELQRRLDVDLGTPDPAVAVARGIGIRRRRRLAVGVGVGAAAAAVAAVALVVPGSDDGATPAPAAPPSPARAEGWEQLPDVPGAVGSGMVAAAVGDEIVFLGGSDASGTLTSGYAFDPATDTWRTIAEAPRGYDRLRGLVRVQAVGDTLLVAENGKLQAYDAVDDAWHAVAQPPLPTDVGALAGGDTTAYVPARDGRIMALDVDADTWTVLPEDTLSPDVADVFGLVATPDGVAASVTLDQNASPDGDATWLEVWDGTAWTRHETGSHAEFGFYRDGRVYAIGLDRISDDTGPLISSGAVDLETGEFTEFDTPDPDYEAPQIWASDARHVIEYGMLYDDASGTWTDLPLPPGTSYVSASAVVRDGQVFLTGGFNPEGDVSSEAWVYTIPE